MTHVNSKVGLPAPVLRPFISHYAGYSAQGLPPAEHRGLPSRHIHLIISLGSPIQVTRLPDPTQDPACFTALVSGLQDAPATVRHDGNLNQLHLFLKPIGARALLRASSADLVSSVVDFSSLWGRASSNLIEQLQAANTWRQRFGILDNEFIKALIPISAPHQLTRAWDRLAEAGGLFPIERLAQDLGWSRRHFSERFRNEYGLSPKTAARIFRFERACRLIKDERPGLALAAVTSGYHDQAHMTHDWQSLAGSTPKQWIAAELPFLQDYELSADYKGSAE